MKADVKSLLIGIVILNILLLDLYIYSMYRGVSTILSETKVLHAAVEIVNALDPNENALGLSSLFEDRLPPHYLQFVHQMYAFGVTQAHRFSTVNVQSGEVSQIMYDTSTNLEASIILRRLHQRKKMPPSGRSRLIVDIGAMDGVSGSNSFNFVALGWDAVLVEPYPPHARSIERNLDLYIKRSYQNVTVCEGAVSTSDGMRRMNVYTRNSKTSNSLTNAHYGDADLITESVISVRSYTPRTLSEHYNIPHNFAVLSIDAEGVDVELVRMFLEYEFRPLYIILELRDTFVDPHHRPDAFVAMAGYQQIALVGSNVIWELI